MIPRRETDCTARYLTLYSSWHALRWLRLFERVISHCASWWSTIVCRQLLRLSSRIVYPAGWNAICRPRNIWLSFRRATLLYLRLFWYPNVHLPDLQQTQLRGALPKQWTARAPLHFIVFETVIRDEVLACPRLVCGHFFAQVRLWAGLSRDAPFSGKLLILKRRLVDTVLQYIRRATLCFNHGPHYHHSSTQTHTESFILFKTPLKAQWFTSLTPMVFPSDDWYTTSRLCLCLLSL